jgi:hypothetical protein
MIIWSGRGILIPIIAIFGFVGGAAGVGYVSRLLGIAPENFAKFAMFLTPIVPVGLLWWFGGTWGKTKEETLLDPRTQQPVILKSRHTFFFLTARVWAVFAGIFGLLLAMTPGTGPSVASSGSSTVSSEFEEADSLLVGKSKGLVHGNSDAAKELAKEFAAFLKEARNEGIEKNSSKSMLSTTGGEFLTYCQLTPEKCAFLVHVPELRKYTAGAKDFISEAAWVAALSALQSRLDGLKEISVGVRGALLYDRAVIGKPGPVENYESLRLRDVQGNSESRQALSAFFEAPPALVPQSSSASAKAPPIAKVQSAPAVDVTPSPPTPKVVAESATMPAPKAGLPASKAQPDPPAPETSVARLREWKDVNGKTLHAAFVRFMDSDRTEAEFQRTDGQFFVIPLERFAEPDREYLLRLPAF